MLEWDEERSVRALLALVVPRWASERPRGDSDGGRGRGPAHFCLA